MRRRTVLVVEDDEDLRRTFRVALSLDGFDVLEARSGFEALRTIETQSPEIIILDLNLPGVNGYAVVTEVRAQAFTRHIPIVVVTGSGDDLNQLDVACVLRKPIRTTELIDTVRRCLDSDASQP